MNRFVKELKAFLNQFPSAEDIVRIFEKVGNNNEAQSTKMFKDAVYVIISWSRSRLQVWCFDQVAERFPVSIQSDASTQQQLLLQIFINNYGFFLLISGLGYNAM